MSRRGQRGAALISAIFLLVVIAAVAAMAANLASTQQLSSGRALDATAAYYAARARLDSEIAAFASSAAGTTCPATPAARPPVGGFATELKDCAHSSVTEGGATYDVFTLRVAAYRGNRVGGSLVRRELRAVISNH